MPLLYKTVSIEFAANEVDSRNTRLVSIAFIGLYTESAPKNVNLVVSGNLYAPVFFVSSVWSGWAGLEIIKIFWDNLVAVKWSLVGFEVRALDLSENKDDFCHHRGGFCGHLHVFRAVI